MMIWRRLPIFIVWAAFIVIVCIKKCALTYRLLIQNHDEALGLIFKTKTQNYKSPKTIGG